jgi:hypothetical protein
LWIFVDAEQMMTRRRIIFNLSFNKCGTSTFHNFLMSNGVRSRSHGSNALERNIAHNMFRNFNIGRNLLHGIDQFEAYGDICYASNTLVLEANQLFPHVFRQYPGHYFFFADRPVEDWIRSRIAHSNFLERHMAYFGIEDRDAMLDLWREQYVSTRSRIIAHFAENGGNFLLFDLYKDKPERICEFLKPDYQLDSAHWEIRNASRKLTRPGNQARV